ncbi:hypothetical protein V6N11_067741 [Hibiscus sabdariffa]|uniref:Uncharacterized protein n=1 Tax=Hibiscus sabdariffa TaxID=183260 RepID=A0ABR2SSA2_9ROSI
MRIRRLHISVILGRRQLRYFSVKLNGERGRGVRFEIMGRGEAKLHDDGFGSLMSDEALTAVVSDEPGIGSPMSDKELTAADLAHRCWTKH